MYQQNENDDLSRAFSDGQKEVRLSQAGAWAWERAERIRANTLPRSSVTVPKAIVRDIFSSSDTWHMQEKQKYPQRAPGGINAHQYSSKRDRAVTLPANAIDNIRKMRIIFFIPLPIVNFALRP